MEKNSERWPGVGKHVQVIAALIFLLLTLFLLRETVQADSALEQVKSNTDKLITILDDTSYRKSHSKDELHEKLRAIVHDRFDWSEIAQRSLGLYWKERSEEEQKEFTILLTNLLENTYINKIVDNYSGEKVLYDKEIVDGTRAIVETRIINQADKEVAVGYRLLKKGDNWLVYDVIIEGVSLVKNYRVQFYDIIRKSSYNDLVKRIKEKQVK